ncbi:MAG: TetR/AcrR family transcriptional regulator [Longispora sp.]|nr:TetR/AcrR family transcriptional regulator [Longispora sp. (in: high G+C Gram-positive bacteria)]
MSSVRNNSPIDQALILEAARDRIVAVGLRRTTLTDIARSAGVSRMTIYRHWSEMSSLVGDLMTREWTSLFDTFTLAATGVNVRAQLVAGLVAAGRGMRAHPMFRRILELDPEILLPYLVDRLGGSQEIVLTQIAGQIKTGQDDGSIRHEDPLTLAAGAVLALQTFTLSGPTFFADPDVLDRELTEMIDRYLQS